jgi:hypothetical protein
MDKIYRGLREDGRWDEFSADSREAATPSASGYEKVVDVETGEEVLD